MGWRPSKTSVVKVAAAALEEALPARGIDPQGNDLTSSPDDGLVFGVIAGRMDHSHGQRPRQALRYLTPDEYRENLAA